MQAALVAVLINLVSSAVFVLIGATASYVLWRTIRQRRYGNWRVVVRRSHEVIIERKVSLRKVKEVLEEPADLSVFLKGIVSPYAWISCDLIEEGEKLGLLLVDHSNRQFVIDLDQNPKSGSSAVIPG